MRGEFHRSPNTQLVAVYQLAPGQRFKQGLGLAADLPDHESYTDAGIERLFPELMDAVPAHVATNDDASRLAAFYAQWEADLRAAWEPIKPELATTPHIPGR